jgi:glycosyltransferase involved in cell wall biosynthesis
MKQAISKNIAIVHDWLFVKGGAEKTLLALLEVLNADIYTFGINKEIFIDTPLIKSKVYTFFLNEIPFYNKFYKFLLPLYPFLIEEIDLSNYDIIISSSYFVAKSVLTNPYQKHICYCYSPARYFWDLYHFYKDKIPFLLKPLFALFSHYFRIWDFTTAQRIDRLIAISKFVSRRIEKYYRRKADVIYPPVDTKFFTLERKKEDFYVSIGRLVPYKRFDLIIEAFRRLPSKRLYIIGDGSERKKLEAIAPSNVKFLGNLSDRDIKNYLQKAKGFVYTALEDFGISVVEAQACGTPVIAYGKGGTAETVINGKTGVLFYKQHPNNIVKAIEYFEEHYSNFDFEFISLWANKFSKEQFQKKFKNLIESLKNND